MLAVHWHFPQGPAPIGHTRLETQWHDPMEAWTTAAASVVARLLAITGTLPEGAAIKGALRGILPPEELPPVGERVAALEGLLHRAERVVTWDERPTTRQARMTVRLAGPATPIPGLPVIYLRKSGYGVFSLRRTPPSTEEMMAMAPLLLLAANRQLQGTSSEDRAPVVLAVAGAMFAAVGVHEQGAYDASPPSFNRAARAAATVAQAYARSDDG